MSYEHESKRAEQVKPRGKRLWLKKARAAVLLVGLATLAASGDDRTESASDPDKAASLITLQHTWAKAMYSLAGDARLAALGELAETSRTALATRAGNAEWQIWHGIITSTLAGEGGGLSALTLVREARAALETAIELDESALQGAAYTSLGALYHKVPGWPIAFGSDKKARRLLKLGHQFNPTGIDANYFLGEFLFNKGQHEEARTYLEAALGAAARPARPLADSGRRAEINALLARLSD